MIYIGVSLLCCFVGIIPLLIKGYFSSAKLVFFISWIFWSFVTFLATPTFFAYPLLGLFGVIILINLIVSAFIDGNLDGPSATSIVPVAGAVLLYVIYLIGSSGMFRAAEYRNLIGPIEHRVWTQDIQPKDEKHLRLIKKDYAIYKAKQALGEAGAIGSQFTIDETHTTLQKIKGDLWYIIPLDFSGFLVWWGTEEIPGYIRVHGEDTNRRAEFIRRPNGKEFRYSPEACWGHDLERHVRMNGYINAIFADVQLETDDEENPYWIISLAKATIGWTGEKITGVLLVDPTTGEIHPKSLENLPPWVDRVFPAEYIKNYLTWSGEYVHGWNNSWNGKRETTKPEDPGIIYSSEQHPDFVTGITSDSDKDTSLLDYAYSSTRTGKTIFYEVKGGSTDSAILSAVNKNQDVQFRHVTGDDPQTYNISGTMGSVVILSNENHIFQGVAIVQVMNVEMMATGKDATEALSRFKALLSNSGQRIALDKDHELLTVEGVIDRATFTVQGGDSLYFLHVKDASHLFTGRMNDFPEIPAIQTGDRVNIEYIDSKTGVVPIHGLKNLSLVLSTTDAQAHVEARSKELRDKEESKDEANTVTENLKELSPKQLQQLGKAVRAAKQKD